MLDAPANGNEEGSHPDQEQENKQQEGNAQGTK